MGPNALKYILNVARKSLVKDQGSGIMKVPGRMDAEAKASEIVTELTNAGLDLGKMDDFIRNEGDVLKYLNILEAAKKERMKPIPADSPRGREITEQLFGKRGEVVDMKGNVIPEGSGIMGGESIESLMKSGDVTKGTVTKKSKKASDRDMFRAANERFKKTDIDKIIKNINKLDPIEAMKEANKIIKRDSYYKGLSDKDAKRILTETEDHIFGRDVDMDPEDFFATGGRVGLKGGGRTITLMDGTKVYIPEGSTTSSGGLKDRIYSSSKGDLLREDIVRLMSFESGGRVGLRGGGADFIPTEKMNTDRMKVIREFLKRKIPHLDSGPIDKSILYDLQEALSSGSGLFPGYDVRNDLPREVEAKGGGRVGLKDGPPNPSRRNFLKIIGGLAALPIVGKFFKPARVGKAVTKVPIIKTADVAGKPEWFDALVNKVILEGDDVTKNFATKDRELVHVKKINDDTSVKVTQDLDEGAIRVEYDSPENMYGDPVQLQYKKPFPDEDVPNPAAQFEVAESGPVGRQTGPDDYDIDIDEVGGSSIRDLNSDVLALKEYATGKKPTMKEIIQKQKRKKKVGEISYGGEAEAEEVVRRQGDFEQFGDIDPDPPEFASGGLAYLLGE